MTSSTGWRRMHACVCARSAFLSSSELRCLQWVHGCMRACGHAERSERFVYLSSSGLQVPYVVHACGQSAPLEAGQLLAHNSKTIHWSGGI